MSRKPTVLPTEARQELAQQQARLVRALKSGEVSDSLWGGVRLAAAAESLLNKRTRSIEKMWPQVAASMDGQLRRYVREYADDYPFAADGPEDGVQFARWLLRRSDVSNDVRIAALTGLTQLGFPIRVLVLRESRALAIAWRSPWGRVRVLRFRR